MVKGIIVALIVMSSPINIADVIDSYKQNVNRVQVESINDAMDNVKMTVKKPINIQEERLNLEINNYEGKYVLGYGTDYKLERYVNGVWIQESFKDRVGFEEIYMESQDNGIAGVDLNKLDRKLESGKYKISKEVFIYPIGDVNRGKNFQLEAEFEIE